MQNKSLRHNLVFVGLIFFLFLFLKINFLEPTLPGIDSSFYINWINSLKTTDHFFPKGNESFWLNLINDSESFCNQFLRRFYNNFTSIFNIFSIFVFTILSFLTGDGYEGFHLSSLIVSSLSSLLISVYILENYNKDNLKNYLLIFLVNFFYLLNFSNFYYSGQGVHNLGIFTLLLSFYFINKNYKKKFFIDNKLFVFGIIIPMFSHSINFLFLTPFFLGIILYRRLKLNYYLNKEEFLRLGFLIFLISILVLTIIFINENNFKFALNFLNFSFEKSEVPLSYYFLKRIESIYFLFSNFTNVFTFLQIITIIISLFFLKNKKIKYLILFYTLFFIIFTLNNYAFGPFMYLINIIYIIPCLFALELLNRKNSKIKNIIFFLFLIFAIDSIYNFNRFYNYKKLNKYEDEFFKTYLNNSPIIIDELKKINLFFSDKDLIFNSYFAKDFYFSINPDQNKNKKNFILGKNFRNQHKIILRDKIYIHFAKSINTHNILCSKIIKFNYDCNNILPLKNLTTLKKISFANNDYYFSVYYFK